MIPVAVGDCSSILYGSFGFAVTFTLCIPTFSPTFFGIARWRSVWNEFTGLTAVRANSEINSDLKL